MTETRIYLRQHDTVSGVYQEQTLIRLELPFKVLETGTYLIEYDSKRPERTTLSGPIVEPL